VLNIYAAAVVVANAGRADVGPAEGRRDNADADGPRGHHHGPRPLAGRQLPPLQCHGQHRQVLLLLCFTCILLSATSRL
jgi:hypothetical protein